MRCTLPESSVTTASPGACFSPLCTTTSDLPSAFQETAGRGCPESAAGPSSASLRSVPPSAGITMHCVFAVFDAQEGQRAAIGRPHRRDVAAFSLGQLLRFAGRQFAHEDVEGADLGTLARAVGDALAIGRDRRVRLGFLAGGKLHALLRHLRSGGQAPHQGHEAPHRTEGQRQHDRRTAEEFPRCHKIP